MTLTYRLCASMLLLLSATLSLAATNNSSKNKPIKDDQAPIEIEADSAEYNRQQGVTTYRGQVVITQGTRRFQADTVHIFSAPGGGMDKLTALGQPARFQHQPGGPNSRVKARALRIDYLAKKHSLRLSKNAKIIRPNDTLESQRIVYNTATGEAESGQKRSAKSGDSQPAKSAGRIKITINPAQ